MAVMHQLKLQMKENQASAEACMLHFRNALCENQYLHAIDLNLVDVGFPAVNIAVLLQILEGGYSLLGLLILGCKHLTVGLCVQEHVPQCSPAKMRQASAMSWYFSGIMSVQCKNLSM